MFGAFFTRRTGAAFDAPKDVPVIDIRGSLPGKTLLVTAGMDGDEYAGIAAAYALGKKYERGDFAGRLVIIPIVNMAGFAAETSMNPVDKKFPKYVFPGTARGSATERLIFWLTTQYAFSADYWVDLHGGSLTESVSPFVWVYKTSAPSVNAHVEQWIARGDASMVVHEQAGRGWQAELLAQRGCMYVLAEAGGRGARDAAAIETHVAWAESLMRHGALLPNTSSTQVSPAVFHHVQTVTAPTHGVFTPSPLPHHVAQGDLIGTYTSYSGTTVTEIRAPRSGTLLWRKETPAMRTGDTLCAIAY